MAIDVHQHLWPAPFLAALRARRAAPRLDGWELELPGQPPYAVTPADHDVEARVAQADADGVALVCISPSAALGLDRLPPAESDELAAAWLEAAVALPAPFRAFAMPTTDPCSFIPGRRRRRTVAGDPGGGRRSSPTWRS